MVVGKSQSKSRGKTRFLFECECKIPKIEHDCFCFCSSHHREENDIRVFRECGSVFAGLFEARMPRMSDPWMGSKRPRKDGPTLPEHVIHIPRTPPISLFF